VTALNPTDGSIKWQLRTDEMDWNLVHGCALADDLLVTVGVDGRVYAIS
jgi:outer membrane protein assembly factor BamB